MTKRRVPGTHDHALYLTVKDLGAKTAAAVIGKSVSFVRQVCNPDNPRSISLSHAALLAAACKARGMRSHLRDWLVGYVLAAERRNAGGDPVDLTLAMCAATGKAADVMRHAMCPLGDGGREITPAEAEEALPAVTDAIHRLEDLQTQLLILQQRYHASPAMEAAE